MFVSHQQIACNTNTIVRNTDKNCFVIPCCRFLRNYKQLLRKVLSVQLLGLARPAAPHPARLATRLLSIRRETDTIRGVLYHVVPVRPKHPDGIAAAAHRTAPRIYMYAGRTVTQSRQLNKPFTAKPKWHLDALRVTYLHIRTHPGKSILGPKQL